jgi:hypothetical protein
LVAFAFSQLALASGEGNSFSCKSATLAGDTVTISGCMDGEMQSFIPCGDEGVEYVTVTKENWKDTYKSPPVIEILRIPGRMFTNNSAEEHFGIELNTPELGKIEVAFAYASYNQQGFNKMIVNTKSIRNSFQVVGCEMSPTK